MIIVVQYILFAFAIILFAFIYPVSGYYQKKRVVTSHVINPESKISWYKESMFWSWVPTLIITTTLLLCGYGLKDIGIRMVDFHSSSFNKWIVYLSVIIFLSYLGYNIYSIIVLKISKESREHSSKGISAYIIALLPVSKKEKRLWSCVAISAGITEEIQYRGYLFFAFPLVFPNIPVALVLVLSTLLFGIGHIYQGKEALRPTVVGLLFGFLYIVFNSIIPVIILHIVQDMVVRDLIDEETNIV